MTKLQLELGKTHKTKTGNLVTIIHPHKSAIKESLYNWRGDNGNTYRDDGRYNWGGTDALDLIEEALTFTPLMGAIIRDTHQPKEAGVGKGLKFDTGKVDLSLLPKSALEATARGFMLGEHKYGRWNYLKGMENGRLVAAAMRHLLDYNSGKWHDEDKTNQEKGFGAINLGNALCCIMMIIEATEQGTLIDTRFKPTQTKEENAK